MKNFIFSILLVMTLGMQPHTATLPTPFIEYYSPGSGTRFNPAQTTLTLRFNQVLDSTALAKIGVHAHGASSGVHSGTLVLSDDQKTVIFKPATSFTLGESVQVDVRQDSAAKLGSNTILSFAFTISGKSSSPAKALDLTGEFFAKQQTPPALSSPSALLSPYLTTPADLPVINVTTPANATGDGYLFLSNMNNGLKLHNYLLILDNQGEPVFYQKVTDGYFTTDFKKLPNGYLAYIDQKNGAYFILDNTYRIVDTISPGNGYPVVDVHELIQLPNGHVLFLIYDPQIVDMSTIVVGGNPQASVWGAIIQELDIQKNVVFQWRSWDHIPITDTNQSLLASTIDYVHANALEVDLFGDILLSSRHLDEITKIDSHTGSIIWRLGGKQNMFTFTSDGAVSPTEPLNFYFQHDIRVMPNGHLSLFDNHNGQSPMFSRALEYAIDTGTMTATLVGVIRANPELFTMAMGNAQRLSNGNTLVGWGASFSPNLTEFKPDGSKAMELTIAGFYYTYRAFRFPWHGYPTWAPSLLVRGDGSGGLNLTISWNGATDIASYQVYGSDAPPITTLITQQSKTGFETTIHLTGAQAASCLFRVMPIDTQDKFTQFTNLGYNPACLKTISVPFIASP